MLGKAQIAELREAVGHIDLDKAIQDAKDMGIEVTKKKLGFHGIYNEDGKLEKIDVDKHFVIGKEGETVRSNRKIQYQTFYYNFKKEDPRNTSPIETDKLLVV